MTSSSRERVGRVLAKLIVNCNDIAQVMNRWKANVYLCDLPVRGINLAICVRDWRKVFAGIKEASRNCQSDDLLLKKDMRGVMHCALENLNGGAPCDQVNYE